jgi:hypothetical protein
MWKFNMVDGFHLRNHMCDSIVTWFFFNSAGQCIYLWLYRNLFHWTTFTYSINCTPLFIHTYLQCQVFFSVNLFVLLVPRIEKVQLMF